MVVRVVAASLFAFSLVACAGAKPSDLVSNTDAINTAPPGDPTAVPSPGNVPGVPTTPGTPVDDPPETTPDGGMPPGDAGPPGGGRPFVALYKYTSNKDAKHLFFSTKSDARLEGYTRVQGIAFYLLTKEGEDDGLGTLKQCKVFGGGIVSAEYTLTLGSCGFGVESTTLGVAAEKKSFIPGCEDVTIDLSNGKDAFGWSAESYAAGRCK